jgi:hypothetical protein
MTPAPDEADHGRVTGVLAAPDTKAGRLQRECLKRLRAHEAQPDGALHLLRTGAGGLHCEEG